MMEDDEPECMGSAMDGDSMLNCTYSPVGGAVAVGWVLLVHGHNIYLYVVLKLKIIRSLGTVRLQYN